MNETIIISPTEAEALKSYASFRSSALRVGRIENEIGSLYGVKVIVSRYIGDQVVDTKMHDFNIVNESI